MLSLESNPKCHAMKPESIFRFDTILLLCLGAVLMLGCSKEELSLDPDNMEGTVIWAQSTGHVMLLDDRGTRIVYKDLNNPVPSYLSLSPDGQ